MLKQFFTKSLKSLSQEQTPIIFNKLNRVSLSRSFSINLSRKEIMNLRLKDVDQKTLNKYKKILEEMNQPKEELGLDQFFDDIGMGELKDFENIDPKVAERKMETLFSKVKNLEEI